jgi:hypothetical protein
VTVASQTKRPATNARILCSLEDLKAELSHTREQQEETARDLARLLARA